MPPALAEGKRKRGKKRLSSLCVVEWTPAAAEPHVVRQRRLQAGLFRPGETAEEAGTVAAARRCVTSPCDVHYWQRSSEEDVVRLGWGLVSSERNQESSVHGEANLRRRRGFLIRNLRWIFIYSLE